MRKKNGNLKINIMNILYEKWKIDNVAFLPK